MVLAVTIGGTGLAITTTLDEILTVGADSVDRANSAIAAEDVLKVVTDTISITRRAVLAVEVFVVLAVVVVDAIAVAADELVLSVVTEKVLVAGCAVGTVLVLKVLAETVGRARITVVVFRNKATRVLRVDADVVVVARSAILTATVLWETAKVVLDADTTVRAVAVLKVVAIGVKVAGLAVSAVEDALSVLADAINHADLAVRAPKSDFVVAADTIIKALLTIDTTKVLKDLAVAISITVLALGGATLGVLRVITNSVIVAGLAVITSSILKEVTDAVSVAVLAVRAETVLDIITEAVGRG